MESFILQMLELNRGLLDDEHEIRLDAKMVPCLQEVAEERQ